MKQANQQFTLAIESAIAGGSLSLLDADGGEIANWVGGDTDIARAEDLLVNIDNMLSSAAVDKSELALIAVSAGPGSFTGIRIGIATALGLKKGLGVEMASVSALEAIRQHTEAAGLRTTVAVPVGRNSICIQSFEDGSPAEGPRTVPEAEFEELMKTGSTFILQRSLFKRYGTRPNAVDFGANIAFAVGRAALPGVVTEPLFVSKSF